MLLTVFHLIDLYTIHPELLLAGLLLLFLFCLFAHLLNLLLVELLHKWALGILNMLLDSLVVVLILVCLIRLVFFSFVDVEISHLKMERSLPFNRLEVKVYSSGGCGASLFSLLRRSFSAKRASNFEYSSFNLLRSASTRAA